MTERTFFMGYIALATVLMVAFQCGLALYDFSLGENIAAIFIVLIALGTMCFGVTMILKVKRKR